MKVIHRIPGARGHLYGVEFQNGIGYTDDPVAIARLGAAGHQVEDEPGEQAADPGEPLPPVPDSAYPPDAEDLPPAEPTETDPWAAPQT